METEKAVLLIAEMLDMLVEHFVPDCGDDGIDCSECKYYSYYSQCDWMTKVRDANSKLQILLVDKVELIRTLAKESLTYHATPRSARISAAIGAFNMTYMEAKDWVEANFSDSGNGDPI